MIYPGIVFITGWCCPPVTLCPVSHVLHPLNIALYHIIIANASIVVLYKVGVLLLCIHPNLQNAP
ncbi:hypothetical protein OBV_38810 [Oscillibacter valericigenes Sjm18-20]|nr:hypothetical protein OBV_38810 [Oscillibacter valericigenes Sjm18-20]